MSLPSQSFARPLFAVVLVSSLLAIGCADHRRYYDPYYHDYHQRGVETDYYSRWERETHRSHMDLNKRNDADQKAYWNWRHAQGNNR